MGDGKGGYCVNHGPQEKGNYCQYCGEQLITVPVKMNDDKAYEMFGDVDCPACGYPLNHRHQKHCPGCGHELAWLCR